MMDTVINIPPARSIDLSMGRINIQTSIDENFNVRQDISINDQIYSHMIRVAQDQANEAVRDALIMLGWTPPLESNKV